MIGELCRQEALKALTQRHVYLLVALVLALQLARMAALHLSPPESALDVRSGVLLWAAGLAWALRGLAYLVLVAGAMTFSREFSLGTAKTLLVLPVTRRQWFAAKLLTLLALAWVLLLACAALGAAVTAATAGWGPVAREGYVLHTAAAVAGHALAAVGLTALLLAPVCAFAVWLGLFFTSSGAAVGVAVLLGVVLELAGGLLAAGRWLFLAHLHRPVALVERLGRGLPVSWEPVLTTGLAVGALSFAVFALWGWWRLERLDVSA